MSTKKTHWLKADYRSNSLHQIIAGLDNSIKSLTKKVEDETDWYDGLWFLEDSEPIYGLAFIAFQNYINGSIKDLYESTNDKTCYYKINPKLKSFEKSDIELIIGLANYIKHKDDNKLHKGTQDILDCFNLKSTDDIKKSPIFEGLSVLNEKWELFEIYNIVTKWRERLFDGFEKTI